MVEQHGSFVWYELMTTDMAAAARFYANVVGWAVLDASTPDLAYSLFTANSISVGGLMGLPVDARKMGATPRWMGYVGVNDVDAAAERTTRLGGTVYVPPTNSNIGRISVVADPQTATLALVKGLKPGQQKSSDLDEPKRVGWHELLAADREKAFAFYTQLFGWQKVGLRTRPGGHVSVVLRQRTDDRWHVHQTSDRAGPILALLLQCRRYRRGRGPREDRRRLDLRGAN